MGCHLRLVPGEELRLQKGLRFRFLESQRLENMKEAKEKEKGLPHLNLMAVAEVV